MKITVKDCLELPSFKEAVMTAGKGLGRRVEAVSFFELRETDDNFSMHKRGELLLTSTLLSEENWLSVIDGLAREGVAGLVLFLKEEELASMGPKVIELAENAEFPLIALPKNSTVTYSDLVNEVMEQVLYGDHFANRLISNTIFHLLNFEKHSNFQSAVREAAINNGFQIVILSEDFNPVFSVETRHRTTIAAAIREAIDRDINKSMIYTKIDVNGALTYWGPVAISGQKHYLLLVDNEDSYSPGEITKLAEIIEIAIGMWKYSPERDARAEFIKALRRGNKSLAYSLKDEAEVAWEDMRSVFCIAGVEKDDCLKIITAFEKKWGYTVLKIHEGDELFGMILSHGDRLGNDKCLALYEMMAETEATALFHVTGVDGIEGSADAYHLINEAWPFIQHIFPSKQVFSKYELALTNNCINISLKGGKVKKNYMDLLEPFRAPGDNKSRQLLETLEIFVLDAGMNTSKTAKLMDIHTNTVQYRLKKIKEVLNADVVDTTVMPAVMVALAIDRIEKIAKLIN